MMMASVTVIKILYFRQCIKSDKNKTSHYHLTHKFISLFKSLLTVDRVFQNILRHKFLSLKSLIRDNNIRLWPVL